MIRWPTIRGVKASGGLRSAVALGKVVGPEARLAFMGPRMLTTPLAEFVHLQFVYLTTTGHTSGQPREIEIWFVIWRAKIYLFAEHGHAANWVKNILTRAAVRVRLGGEIFEATARVIDCAAEGPLCAAVSPLMRAKYGWSDGLPVEISPG
jgi:deazaflavin-dependent oxidoreductase (nitroreductase family)